MVDPKYLGYFVGNIPVGDQVQEIKVYIGRLFRFLEALQRDRADGAAGAVFEYDLGFLLGFGDNLFQLLLIVQMNPMHTRTDFE